MADNLKSNPETTGDELIPIYDDPDPELPAGNNPGRILVHVLGTGATGVYLWEAEALDYDNDTAVFWINEGVGFDWFFDSIDFPGEGYWVVQDVTVSWTRGDGWEIDDDEDHDWGEIRPATPIEIETGLLENQNAPE